MVEDNAFGAGARRVEDAPRKGAVDCLVPASCRPSDTPA